MADAVENILGGDTKTEDVKTDDTVAGGAGNDTVVANAGNDTVVANAGNDTVAAEGDDTVVAKEDKDVLAEGADYVFELPEGMEIDADTAAAAQPVLKELGMKPSQANPAIPNACQPATKFCKKSDKTALVTMVPRI